MMRLWAMALAILLTACGPGAMPRPSPKEYTDVVSALVLRGATVTTQVAGDAGCDDSRLVDNAVRLDVSLAGAPPAAVYLFRWRRQSDFDAEDEVFTQCFSELQARDRGASQVALENAPWRAYGSGWSPALEAAVGEALRSVR